MGLGKPVNGAWQDIESVNKPLNGAWQECEAVCKPVNGAWTEIWSCLRPYKLVTDKTLKGTVDEQTGICTIAFSWNAYGGDGASISIVGEFKARTTYYIYATDVKSEKDFTLNIGSKSSSQGDLTILSALSIPKGGTGVGSFTPTKDLTAIYIYYTAGGASAGSVELKFKEVKINNWLCDY